MISDLAHRARQLAELPQPQFESRVATWRDRIERNGDRVTADILAAGQHDVHFSSETAEHYTPAKIVDAVVACLGTIALNPCSNPGRPHIPATTHYTVTDDGLSREWHGSVYMNPPYGRTIDQWVAKLLASHGAGTVPAAIALLPARTDTQWFRQVRDAQVCFIAGRLAFLGQATETNAPFPSMACYWGARPQRFVDAFAPVGDIWQRVDR